MSGAAMRRLVYLVAASADGFIARPDGSFDGFLFEGEHIAGVFARWPETAPGHARDALGVHGPNRRFDAVLMGRGTYDVGLKVGVTSPYPHLAQYVFSRSLTNTPAPGVELVRGDALASVQALKRHAGGDIWLCGGGELAATLFPAIDELVLKLHPVVFGRGLPLFGGDVAATRMELTERHVFATGVVLLAYRLRHPGA